MALDPREFIMTEQWASEASVIIPSPPPAGMPFRNQNLSPEVIRKGQFYNSIADSANWNQLLNEATGMAKMSGQYGIPIWSPREDYTGNASLCIGVNGTPYRAKQDSGPSSKVGPKNPITEPQFWISLPEWISLVNGGIPKWSGGRAWRHPAIVWDGAGSVWDLWVSLRDSGTAQVGDQKPSTTTGYWMRLSEWIMGRLTPAVGQTFYVRSSGNDSNSGFTADEPFKTINGAIVNIQRRQFASPFGVVLDVGKGLFSETIVLPAANISSLSVRIKGAGQTSTIIDGGDKRSALSISSGRVYLENISLTSRETTTPGFVWTLNIGQGAACYLDDTIIDMQQKGRSGWETTLIRVFNGHLSVPQGCSATFTGSASQYLVANNSVVSIGDSGSSIPATLNFRDLTCSAKGVSLSGGSDLTLHGAVACKVGQNVNIASRYHVDLYSCINATGRGFNFLPGDADGVVDKDSYALYYP